VTVINNVAIQWLLSPNSLARLSNTKVHVAKLLDRSPRKYQVCWELVISHHGWSIQIF